MGSVTEQQPIEARCPICRLLLFRWSPRTYGAGSEVTQTASAVEVRCKRCRSTITFGVPGGDVIHTAPGSKAPASSARVLAS